MKSNANIFLSALAAISITALLNGCATGPKNMQPVAPTLTQSELLKAMDVKQQPELEPEWADFVKQSYPNWKNHYWVDRGQWGNRGWIVGKAPTDSQPPVTTEITPLPPAAIPVAPPEIVPSEPPKVTPAERPTTYTVKKGDSLWRIAGKVYGNPLKWGQIYRANKAKLKSPHKIYPGQVLTIP